MLALSLALLVLGQAEARSVGGRSSGEPLSPALKHDDSDKKFFGKQGNYAEDTRPVVQKSILNKLKGPDQPYPALQSKDKFDRDFVKDENSDTGAWKAQFEYDALRKKLMKEEGDAKGAESRANKEGLDVDAAKAKADAAAKAADDAKKDADGANKGEAGAKEASVDAEPPSAEALEKLKKKVAEAEVTYAKEQEDFKKCKAELEAAEKAIEDLKAKQVEMEQKLAGDTKLWAETKSARLNLKAARQEAAGAKRAASAARLKVAQNNKADLDAILAKEKAESDASAEHLRQQKAELAKAHEDLDAATLRLQKLRGYTPAEEAALKKSSAHVQSLFSVVALLALRFLF